MLFSAHFSYEELTARELEVLEQLARGRANKENPPKLEFSGMGMLKDHCIFEYHPETHKVELVVKTPGARCCVILMTGCGF